MSWTCPECGKELKKQGNHPATHLDDGDEDFNVIEEILSNGVPLGGEISRLRNLRAHDTSKDWNSVYNSYAKVTKGEGTIHKRIPLEGAANTRRERQELRSEIRDVRRREEW